MKLTGVQTTRSHDTLDETIDEENVPRRGRGRPRLNIDRSESIQRESLPSELIPSEITSNDVNEMNEHVENEVEANTDTSEPTYNNLNLRDANITLIENDDSNENFEPNYYFKNILKNDNNKRELPDRRAKRNINYRY